jgi:hypothetical protein
LRGEQRKEVRALGNAFIDFLPEAVAGIDAPLVPPPLDAFRFQRIGDPSSEVDIVGRVAQKHTGRCGGHRFILLFYA